MTFYTAKVGTIGWAVAALKTGHKVRRRGWNGKGMCLVLVPGSTFKIEEGRPFAKVVDVGTEVSYQPHVDMHTADGTFVPWLCSQSDLLADDWEIAG